MNVIELVLLVIAVALGGGFLWAMNGRQKALSALTLAQERLALMEESRATMSELVKAQAAQSAQTVAEQLVTRATETFQAQDRAARERMEAQLKPVAEQLQKFQEHVSALEKTRAEDTGGLKAQIAALMQASVETQGEARRLSQALRRG
ncbi:DNA recombination protein RmuC, partial [Rhizobium sp. CRIBSB]|nr:DNA recombination protein RmuC [Rhizobium sp. CRIBSB]